MRARDIMTSPVITVRPAMTIKEAARLLATHGFTALPVVDDDERLIGIVTEADLVRDRIRWTHGRTSCPATNRRRAR
jgi:CBS domain-containing protein